jgi:RHS repeat-associated protein
MAAHTDFNGHTTTYTYNNMNRLTSKVADAFFSTGACAPTQGSPFPCGAAQISYSYTATGKRAGMSDATGNWGYAYDSADRLTDKFSGEVQNRNVHWEYDPAGNITALQQQRGQSASYGYDALNRLQNINVVSVPPTYSYDEVGNLAQVNAGPLTTSYQYDSQNRLTQMQIVCNGNISQCASPGRPLASYAYTLGPAGNRLSVTELSGRSVTYTYDELYRLTSETIAGAAIQNGVVNYTYDAVGNRKQLNSTVPAIPASGLLNYDANDRTTTDPYDANGNLLNGGAGGNVYDFENRLVQAGGVQIVYDGDGNRVQETAGGTSTFYVVADINPTGYPQVVQEQTPDGAFLKDYIWGLDLLRSDVSGGSTYYGHDGHGSVRFLTDTRGRITDTYDYDAFGNLINSTGSTPNNYLFAGEQFDPALGIYYNRARYYDQRRGRFWTMDIFEGDPESPASLHKYLFCGADPSDCVDPSGYASQVETLGSAGIYGGLQGINVVNVLKVLGFVASGLLVGIGLGAMSNVIIASRANSKELAEKRKEAKEEAERRRRNPSSKLLFHYTTQVRADLIAVSGSLLGFAGRGGFPFGAYATDIAGWLVESVMRRSQLTALIFGRNTPENYAQTEWVVAFEQNPRYPFKKIAPFIYWSGLQETPIFIVYVGPNLLGE